MIEIIPAIMPKRFSDIEQDIEQVVGVTPIVQIDLCDGIFVPNRTWPFEGHGTKEKAYQNDETMKGLLTEDIGMPEWETVDYELDLMVRDPGSILPDLMPIGPKRITVHLASLTNPAEFFAQLDNFYKVQIEIGLAITSESDMDVVASLVPEVSYIQCMGIENVGFQHQEFNTKILDTIRTIRAQFPTLPISVDGAVNDETIEDLIEAGATRLVIGSAIWESETPGEMVRHFKRVAYDKVNLSR